MTFGLSYFLRKCDEALRENAKMSGYSMIAVGLVGAIAHSVYGLLWVYVTPLDHENVWLRSIGAALHFGLLANRHWPESWKRFLPWYWFGTVVYSLPFFATFQLLGSNYSMLRSMIEVTMVFLVIVVFPRPLLAVTNMAIGMLMAVAAAYLLVPNFASLNHSIVKSVHVQVMVYAVVAGLIFSRSNLKGLLAQEKIETMKALAGSIAHELRNPLSQLRYRLDSMGEQLPPPTTAQPGQVIATDDLNALYRELAKGKLAIERGLQVIAMTLDELHAKPIPPESLRYLSAADATRKAVDEYSYDTSAERDRVSVEVLENFTFRGDETRYAFVLFNLLKNATYYFKQYPRARVTIAVAGGSVTVMDTGPGMSAEALSRLFEPFHTAGKPGGTGLGLAFCKRTMRAFGGDISCESERGKYTRFVLRFPPVGQEELARHASEVLGRAGALFGGRRVLIVDDVAALRQTARALLEPVGAQMDEADNGEAALRMLAHGGYHAVVLDLSMPVLDGYAVAARIRAGALAGQEHLPIVAYTAESPHSARVKLEKVGVAAFVQKPCSQLELVEALIRAAEDGARRAAAAQACSSLAGKTILLADDQSFNRKFLRGLLRERGVQVLEAGTGQEVLDRLREVPQVDAVLTDINMPGLNGLEVTRAIRAMPEPLGRTPVIALTAHSDESMVDAARAAGMNDFVVKPVEPAEFFEKLSRQLQPDAAPAPAGSVRHAPAGAADPAALLDDSRLQAMVQMDMVQSALDDTRALLDKLAACARARNFDEMKEVMHSLVGIAGEMGARALHRKLRSLYAHVAEEGQWPPEENWLAQLEELYAQTERAMRAERLEPVG